MSEGKGGTLREQRLISKREDRNFQPLWGSKRRASCVFGGMSGAWRREGGKSKIKASVGIQPKKKKRFLGGEKAEGGTKKEEGDASGGERFEEASHSEHI